MRESTHRTATRADARRPVDAELRTTHARRCPARGVLVMMLILSWLAGCFNGENGHQASEPGWVTPGDSDVEALIEERLVDQLPPPPEPAVQTLREVKLHRRRVASQMIERAESALAPLAFTAALFAVDGPVDLLLNVVLIGKLGRAFERGREALRARKARKLTDKIVSDFAGALDSEHKHILRLAQHLRRADVRALKTIHRHTGSQAVITALLDRHVRQSADVRWIAAKLEHKKVSPVFARRYTFDADLVEDITRYKAGIPWKTLQDVIEGNPVTGKARGALAVKIVGMLGERAAATLAREPAFARKYLKQADESFTVSRGLSYTGGSLDLVATASGRKVLYGEVKNWSADTWRVAANREKILDQLRRHNRGIAEHLVETGRVSSNVVSRVLFVADRGYRQGVAGVALAVFQRELKALGWTIEYIPNKRIGTYPGFLDDLR